LDLLRNWKLWKNSRRTKKKKTQWISFWQQILEVFRVMHPFDCPSDKKLVSTVTEVSQFVTSSATVNATIEVIT
jgi:hypothetical protein